MNNISVFPFRKYTVFRFT